MADRRSFEEIVADIAEISEAADLAEELSRGYGKSTLREDAGRAAELEKQLIAANAKINKLERGPQLTKAFTDYGVDMEGLRPAELRALETYDGELDPEKIAAFVQEYDLPLLNGQLEGEQEPQVPAARIAAQAAAPQSRRGPARQQITPDTVRGWNERSPEKWMRFKQAHPDEAEQLLQGQTVEGLTFE